MKKTFFFIFLIIAFIFFSNTQQTISTITGHALGTTYKIKFIRNKVPLKKVAQEIKNEIEDINNKMSTYLKTSELSEFNNYQEKKPFQISSRTMQVIQLAQEISILSSGAFDITVGPLVNLWGFGPKKNTSIPNKQKIKDTLNKIGYKKLLINPKERTIKKQQKELYLDLSAIAKGYAVDIACQALDKMQIENYMVEIGGEIRVRGHKVNKKPWILGIESPQKEMPYKIVSLKDQSLATSGDYRNFRYDIKTKKRLSHTINPHTGYPVTHKLASVSVISNTCMEADAMATALLVLGEIKGYELAKNLRLPCYFIIREKSGFITKETPEFSKFFK